MISTFAVASLIESREKKPRRRPLLLIASIPGIILAETWLLTRLLLATYPPKYLDATEIFVGADILEAAVVAISTFAAVSFVESKSRSLKESE